MKTSGSKKIAERYVSALFDVTQDADALVAVEKDFVSLDKALHESPDFNAFLHNPLLTRAAQEAIASALLKSMSAHALTAQFIAVLARQKRLPILPAIVALFLQVVAQARGELAVELVSARALSAGDANAVAEKLGKAYNKKITLTTREDASLLGGVIVNIGSLQLDSSLAGKLNRLKNTLRAA